MDNKVIYFDSAAKTIPYSESMDAFTSNYSEFFANPSSIHFEGVKANRKLDKNKEDILSLLKLNNHKVVFTSCATESNNLAIKGFALKYKNRGRHIICSAYEHPSVKDVVKQLVSEYGFEATFINPNKDGVIEVNDVIQQIRNDTILVSIMAVNNEIGTINPIEKLGLALQKYPKLVFHCDAAQAIGKIDINYQNVDMISVSSHKIHGLSTGGSLIIKKTIELQPLLAGGGQEFGLRSGTVDVASACAFAAALKKSIKEQNSHFDYVASLADKLYCYLYNKPDLFEINSNPANPYIVNFSTLTKKGSVVVEALSSRGIMVSSTSACSSSKEKGSYVVASLGKNDQIANNTIRVSFSFLNKMEEVERLISELNSIIGEIR